MIIGIVILFVAGQAISAYNMSNGFPGDDDIETYPEDIFDDWETDLDEVTFVEPPGGFSEDAFIGPAWLPVPEGWTQDLVAIEQGSEFLTLTPEGTPGSQLRFIWEPNSTFYDPSELCSSTVAELTADSSIEEDIEIFYNYTEFEAAACFARTTLDATSTDYRVTAFLDPSSMVSLVTISQRDDEPVDEDFDAWDRYLTCSVGEQLGIIPDNCFSGN